MLRYHKVNGCACLDIVHSTDLIDMSLAALLRFFEHGQLLTLHPSSEIKKATAISRETTAEASTHKPGNAHTKSTYIWTKHRFTCRRWDRPRRGLRCESKRRSKKSNAGEEEDYYQRGQLLKIYGLVQKLCWIVKWLYYILSQVDVVVWVAERGKNSQLWPFDCQPHCTY